MPAKAKLTTRQETTTQVSADNLAKGTELTFAEADSNFINLRDQTFAITDGSTSSDVTAGQTITVTGTGGITVTQSSRTVTIDGSGITPGSSIGDLSVIGSTILSPSNADLTFDTSGTGEIRMLPNKITLGPQPGGVGNAILTTAASSSRDLELSTNNGTNTGIIKIQADANQNILITPNGTGATAITNPTLSGTVNIASPTFTGTINHGNLQIVTSPTNQIKNDTANFLRIEEIGFIDNRIVAGYDAGSTGKDLDIIIDPTYNSVQFNIIDRLNVSTQYDSGGGGTLNANDGKRLTMGGTAGIDPFTGYSGYRTLFNKGGTDHVFTIFGYTASGTPPKLFNVDNGQFSNNNTVQIRDYEFNTSEEITTINTNQDIKLNPNGTGTVDLDVPTSATIGANGSASALTANPVGYLKIKVNGTEYQIPYYNI
jgi:hypothetical protein